MDLTDAAWRTSSYSSAVNNCVAVAPIRDGVAIRDSKNPLGGVLRFSGQQSALFRDLPVQLRP